MDSGLILNESSEIITSPETETQKLIVRMVSSKDIYERMEPFDLDIEVHNLDNQTFHAVFSTHYGRRVLKGNTILRD